MSLERNVIMNNKVSTYDVQKFEEQSVTNYEVNIPGLEAAFNKYANSKKNIPFYVKGQEQASMVYRVFFNNVKRNLTMIIDKKDIELITSDPDLLKKLATISRNVALEIVLNNTTLTKKSELFRIGSKGIIYQVNGQYKVKDMLIADNKMVKIEEDPENFGAWINFYDKKGAKELSKRLENFPKTVLSI